MIAYTLGDIEIRDGKRRREWMDKTPSRFAYLCHPLVVANEAGFDVILSEAVTSEWDGGIGLESVRVSGPAVSNFGSGVVTFHIPAVIRTEPGVHCLVTGPPNEPKDGIYPLTGIVETSWIVATFTMNYKHTRPGTVRWEAGEVYCRLIPGVIFGVGDSDHLVRHALHEDSELEGQYAAWAEKRRTHYSTTGERDLDYRRGTSPGGKSAPPGEHWSHARRRG